MEQLCLLRYKDFRRWHVNAVSRTKCLSNNWIVVERVIFE